MKINCFDFDPQDTLKVSTNDLLNAYAKCCNCEFISVCEGSESIYYELLERGEDM